MMSTVVEMKNLACQSGRTYLLKNINWQIEKGDHWIVFGLNGCGKTTLLSIISGFQKYTHGTLEVFGQPYSEYTVFENRKRIGFVSSSFFDKCYHREQVLQIVLSGLTGTLNVDGSISDRDILRVKRILHRLGIADKMDMPFHFLSKGERQNVLIARAIIADPDLLILDEPGTGLDIIAREKLLKFVDNIARNTDKTIIFVTHYLEECLASFEKSLLLKNGKVYGQGMTSNLFAQQNLYKFLDSMPNANNSILQLKTAEDY